MPKEKESSKTSFEEKNMFQERCVDSEDEMMDGSEDADTVVEEEGSSSEPENCANEDEEWLPGKDVTIKSEKGGAKSFFRCPRSSCNRIYYSRCGLEGHIRSAHEGKFFKCPTRGCNRKYVHLISLERHLRLHMNKGYLCTVGSCRLQFSTRCDLLRHQATHGKGRKRCPFRTCGRHYRDDKEYLSHVTTHKLMEYKCRVMGCNEVFKHKNKWEEHMLNAHTRQSYGCPYPGCDIRLTTEDVLRSHIIVSHFAP